MEIGVGSILEGKVTGITKFGAFVSLGGDKSGLVHISEIADTYVNEVSEHLEKGQTVKVKVLSIDENGRINLSIRRALNDREERGERGAREERGMRSRRSRAGKGNAPARPAAPMTAEEAFEAKLKAFMTESEGKISALHHSDKYRRR